MKNIDILKNNNGKILTSNEIRKLFSFSKHTALVDTWLTSGNHIVALDRSEYDVEHDMRRPLFKLVYNEHIKQPSRHGSLKAKFVENGVVGYY